MKLLCWNIGIKIDNTEEVIDFVRSDSFDILAFQEALDAKDEKAYQMYRTKNDIENSFNFDYPFSDFTPVWGATEIIKNGKAHRDFGGFVEQGNLILSKYKIIEHHNQFYYLDYKKPGFDATYFKRDDHARSIQNAIIEINGQKLRIINVHGIWNRTRMGDDRTLSQSRFIIEKATAGNYPTIIVGDFNLLPESKSISLIDAHFRNLTVENGIKSTRPIMDDGLDRGEAVCDYVFVNELVKVNSFEVLDNNISDHMPLILDFDI